RVQVDQHYAPEDPRWARLLQEHAQRQPRLRARADDAAGGEAGDRSRRRAREEL
ncbi:unnamed protein product, partial [Prorocentrum cordatum]